MEIKLEDKLYRFYELKNELTRALENCDKLKTQYQTLIDVVENSGKQEELPDNFVEELKNYSENLDKQIAVITQRLVYIGTIIDTCELKDEKANIAREVISLVFESLGIEGEPTPEPAQEIIPEGETGEQEA